MSFHISWGGKENEKFHHLIFDIFKILPPGGTRPIVYFFVFACLQHVPLRSNQVSFHKVINFYDMKLFLKSIFM